MEERGLENETLDLIKIDVQGAEIDVLKGAVQALSNGPFVLLETQILEYNKGAPMLTDVIVYMASIGYQPCDMFEMHYLPNTQMLNQVDILFAPKDHPVFELPAHAESAIAPPEQTAVLGKLIRTLTSTAEADSDVLIIDSPGHVVLGQYLEHGFKSHSLTVRRISLGEPLPKCSAVYLMPGADTETVLQAIESQQILSVTGFSNLVEEGSVSLGLELNANGEIQVIANANRLKQEGQTLPDALSAIARIV